METLSPDILVNNRYRVIKKIGQGGMGAVYEAFDERLKNHVALKQTLVDGDQFSRAFEREAQLLAGLRHPALPRVFDHFVDDRGQFLVMDYIPGDDLASLLKARNAPFGVEEVLRWADAILDALEYLHAQQPPIIHRDIKPQNLKLTPRGEIVLLDFGLAKGSTAMAGQVSRTASLFGYTPQYAPIEQVQGTGTDPRSDIYSLGATLFHLLSGQTPADVLTRAAAVLNRQPDPLQAAHELNPAISITLSGALDQALTLAADERFGSATAMRRALRQTGPLTAEEIEEQALRGPVTGPTLIARAPISQPRSQPISQPSPDSPLKTRRIEPDDPRVASQPRQQSQPRSQPSRPPTNPPPAPVVQARPLGSPPAMAVPQAAPPPDRQAKPKKKGFKIVGCLVVPFAILLGSVLTLFAIGRVFMGANVMVDQNGLLTITFQTPLPNDVVNPETVGTAISIPAMLETAAIDIETMQTAEASGQGQGLRQTALAVVPPDVRPTIEAVLDSLPRPAEARGLPGPEIKLNEPLEGQLGEGETSNYFIEVGPLLKEATLWVQDLDDEVGAIRIAVIDPDQGWLVDSTMRVGEGVRVKFEQVGLHQILILPQTEGTAGEYTILLERN